jgi:hypothetical protein
MTTSTALVVREPRLGTLGDLAQTANREHRLVENALGDAVAHAFAAGDALNQAAQIVEFGEWGQWLAHNFSGSPSLAKIYRRMATYRELLLEHGVTSIASAHRILVTQRLTLAKPDARGNLSGQPPLSEDEVNEIRRLFKAGVPKKVIARTVGVSVSTVRLYVVPGRRQQVNRLSTQSARRRRQATRALAKQDLEKRARSRGDDLGESYVLIRKLTETLQAAIGSASGDTKKALNTALASAYSVEDEIGKALRLS